MRELSLFSGAGFGSLGTKLLGWQTIGYVEINDFCQKIIAQRIEDGILDAAPIFGDVRDFIFSGAAEQYRGFADVVTAGFPCQPFSVAGRNKGAEDDRNLFPELLGILRTVRPRRFLLENVPNLLAHEYCRTIFGELAALGYDLRWDCISAAACGAPHKRDRLWIVGTDAVQDAERIRRTNQTSEKKRVPTGQFGNTVSGSDERVSGNSEEVAGRSTMADSEHTGRTAAEVKKVSAQRSDCHEEGKKSAGQSEGCGKQYAYVADPAILGVEGRWTARKQKPSTYVKPEISVRDRARGKSTNWEVEPRVGRLVDGCPDRVQRLKAIGNAQVPQVVATAWRLLNE